MSLSRTWAVCRLDLQQNARRPLIWILLLLLGLCAWGLTTGNMRIGTGDSSVGGTKAFITSEFANARVLTVFGLTFYAFFVAVGLGMTVIRDGETKIGELLHSTPLRPAEYVWGKFAGGVLTFFGVLLAHLGFMVFFNHALAGAESAEFIGPLVLANYLKPALIFTVPTLLFLAGASFFLGTRTGKPILVFFAPLALLLLCVFFLWTWSPSWLDPRVNQLLMLIEPTGYRWLNETHLTVDRGVEFYNAAAIPLDTPFVLSRLAFAALGLLAVWSARRHFTRTLRGRRVTLDARQLAELRDAPPPAMVLPTPAPLAALQMDARPPGFLRGTVEVARSEFRELRTQPGLYLFVPLIIVEAVANSMFATGAFDTPLLLTSGTLAVRSMGFLTTMICLLLLFYVVESLRREEGSGLQPIHYATPLQTGSLLFGKMLANSFVALVAMVVTLGAFWVALLAQGKVTLDLSPFLLLWGLLLVPTFLLWSSFVSLIYALTSSRYTTYGLALGALILTGYNASVGNFDWLVNWPLWGTVRWSDMGTLELDGEPLLYNRLFAIALTVLFTVLTFRVFPRRKFDPTRVAHRMRPANLARTALRLSPFLLAPVALAFLISSQVGSGFQGDAQDKAAKDYWRKNIQTYLDFPVPDLAAVDVTVDLEPEERGLRSTGTMRLINPHAEPLDRILVTAALHWHDKSWTMNGAAYEPEDRQNLLVFTPQRPLAPGASMEIGFALAGRFPDGWSRNGGGTGEFVLPAGVVLTSFSGSFVPILGYREDVGVDDENRSDSREYADDYFEGITPNAFGSGIPFHVRTTITGPEEYTLNGVGILESDTVADGRRTSVWQSDHPVRFFNIVAGRWQVRRGQGTAIYYHAGHPYNIEEMIETLDATRTYYSKWFYPYPWQELKVSEFPALATYAQGFPTNITFSESIGFLTESDPDSNMAFMVTAHEAAHQWWGNLLSPGDGPGGNILSEGMAHFSTILLFDQVLGLEDRLGFCKLIESRYGDGRRVDSERPLVKIDGTRPGDNTVTYDKGGWVFWMLLDLMGRDAALAGLRSFIDHYQDNRDHPVLQDFVAHLRPFAPDAAAYDAFVQQWFFAVVVPEYRLADAVAEPVGGDWRVTVRIRNVGSGRMPVVVAASRGERFAPADAKPEEAYRDVRETVLLGEGDEATVTLTCDFEPQRLVVDPDGLVLQLQRERAIHRF